MESQWEEEKWHGPARRKRSVQTAMGTWYPETTNKMGGKMLPLVHKPFAGAIWQAVLLVEAELP